MRGTTALQSRRRQRSQRGVALVEFAIVVPVLFALLLGTITVGFALSQKNSLTNATREGARLGATLPSSATWGTSAQGRVVQLAAGDLRAAEVCVRLRTVTGAAASSVVRERLGSQCASSGEAAMPTGAVVGDCYVSVWSRRTALVEAVFFTRSITLTSAAVGRYERGSGATCAA